MTAIEFENSFLSLDFTPRCRCLLHSRLTAAMQNQQPPPHDHQIGQAKQAAQLHVGLSQTEDLAPLVPKQFLDRVKPVFDLRARAHLNLLDISQRLAHRAVAELIALPRLHCDVPARTLGSS